MSIGGFTVLEMDRSAASGRDLIFDLRYMEDIQGVLGGTSRQSSITTFELNYIRTNWTAFQENTFFLRGNPADEASWSLSNWTPW